MRVAAGTETTYYYAARTHREQMVALRPTISSVAVDLSGRQSPVELAVRCLKTILPLDPLVTEGGKGALCRETNYE